MQPPFEPPYSEAVSGNIEIIERAVAAFNEEGIDGALHYIGPDFEVTTPPELASEPDTYRGHEGARRWFDSFDEVMDEIRWDARNFREVEGRVVVEFTLHAKGKTSGLNFGQDAVMVWELRDGKAIRVSLYTTVEAALASIEEAATG